MITAETLRRIAPKQGDPYAQELLTYVADLIDRADVRLAYRLLEYIIAFALPAEKQLKQAAEQLLQIMRSPEVIDEWTPVGGDTDE